MAVEEAEGVEKVVPWQLCRQSFNCEAGERLHADKAALDEVLPAPCFAAQHLLRYARECDCATTGFMSLQPLADHALPGLGDAAAASQGSWRPLRKKPPGNLQLIQRDLGEAVLRDVALA